MSPGILQRRNRNWLVVVAVVIVVAIVAVLMNVINDSPKSDTSAMIVGLGDSYASGEGLAPYEPASDTRTDHCHRSVSQSFTALAAALLKQPGKNVACSGATISSMLNGENGEPSQISQIDPKALNVAVMIGGNDVNALGTVLQTPSPEELKAKADRLQAPLTDAFKKIRAAASPKAHVVAIGYPSIVPLTAPQGCPFTATQLKTLNDGAALLNATIVLAAKDAGIQSINPTGDFRGHELCTTDPWVNGLDVGNPTGSLHPNAQGQAKLANLLVDVVRKEK